MSYSIMMSRLDEKKTNRNDWEKCTEGTDLKFDDTKTWTNLFDYIILYKKNNIGDWDFLMGCNEKSSYVETVNPDHSLWKTVCSIADKLEMFIYGESNEIYYIPNYGEPEVGLDFEKAKMIFKQKGFDLDFIIENARLEM